MHHENHLGRDERKRKEGGGGGGEGKNDAEGKGEVIERGGETKERKEGGMASWRIVTEG